MLRVCVWEMECLGKDVYFDFDCEGGGDYDFDDFGEGVVCEGCVYEGEYFDVYERID